MVVRLLWDGAGADKVNLVFFGYLTPEVEQVRYNNMYHPRSVEEKSPALARVLRTVSEGLFGDGGIYEPYVFVPISRSTPPNLRLLQIPQHCPPGRLLPHRGRLRLL